MSEPIRVMLGGSAANFAVHATNLNNAQQVITATPTLDAQAATMAGAMAAAEGEAAKKQTTGDGAAGDGISWQLRQQTCVLHTSVAGDDMGDFVRRKLDEYGVEWSQVKQHEHQVKVTMRRCVGMELMGLRYGSFYLFVQSPFSFMVLCSQRADVVGKWHQALTACPQPFRTATTPVHLFSCVTPFSSSLVWHHYSS